jgi:hypothetical protein
MDFTSLSDAYETCTKIVDGISDGIVVDVDPYAILIHVRGTSSSGIMDIYTFCSFSFISLSISSSISLI